MNVSERLRRGCSAAVHLIRVSIKDGERLNNTARLRCWGVYVRVWSATRHTPAVLICVFTLFQLQCMTRDPSQHVSP